MRRLAVLLALLAPLEAAAADWSQTFDPASLKSYLEGEQLKVVVVTAGDAGEAARSAAGALATALRQSGKAQLVMDDAALGAVSALDDQAIVARSAALPVDLIATFRAFPGASGELETAVVTFYDKQGKVLAALTAQVGQKLAAKAGGAGQGVSAGAASSVSQILGTTHDDASSAREEFEKRVILCASVANWFWAYEGKYKKPLEGADFYERVERPELAKAYRRNVALKWLLGLAGLGISIGGIAYMVSSTDDLGGSSPDIAPFLIGLGVGTLVGPTVMSIGIFMSAHPVEGPEALEISDNFNKKLARGLGLPENTTLRLSGRF